MIRLVICLLFASLILTSCTNESSKVSRTVEKPVTIKIDTNKEIIDMALDSEGNIYVVCSSEILVYNQEGKKTSTLVSNLAGCRNITINNDIIYLIDNDGESLKEFDLKGKKIKEQDIKAKKCERIEVVGDILVISIVDPKNPQENYIKLVNLTSGGEEKLDFKNIIGFSMFTGSNILVLMKTGKSANSSTLAEYDCKAKKAGKEYYSNDQMSEIAYSNEDNQVYFIQASVIKKFDLKTYKTQTIYRYTASHSIGMSRIAFEGNLCYVLDVANKLIHKFDRDNMADENSKSIVIAVKSASFIESSNFTDVIELFNRMHPDIQVKFKELGSNSGDIMKDMEEYENTLRTKLMAGDKDFDLFWIDSGIKQNYYIRSGCMLDLSSYSAITGKLDKMFTGVKDLCTYEGKIFGVPDSMSIPVLKVNEELYKKLGIDLPKENWSVQDFYKLAVNARKDLNGDGNADTYIVEYGKDYPLFMQRYRYTHLDSLNSKVMYKDSELADLLELWKKMCDERLILEPEKNSNGQMDREMKSNVLLYMDFIFGVNHGEKKYVCFPAADSGESYPVFANYLCANKSSANKEIAVDFLACYISEDYHYTYPDHGLYADIAQYAKRVDPMVVFTPPSEKNMDILKFVYKSGKFSNMDYDLQNYEIETTGRFMRSEITSQKAAQLIKDKSKTMLEE